MADAFLHRRSIFDKHKDAYGLKNPIKQMRVARSWDNPITRNKREKSLNDWASSFAGKRHYRKLSRHNALHLHEGVDMNKVSIEEICDTLNRYAAARWLPFKADLLHGADGKHISLHSGNTYLDIGYAPSGELEVYDAEVAHPLNVLTHWDSVDEIAGHLLSLAVRQATKNESVYEKLSFEKGHKDSKGNDAPWVIRSHDDGKVLASFTNKDDAVQHLARMKNYSKKESFMSLKSVLHESRTKKLESFAGAASRVVADNKLGKIVKARLRDNVLAFLPIDDDGKNDDCIYFFRMDGDDIITKGYHWGRDEIDRSMIADDGYPWTAEPNRPTRDWVHTKAYAKQLIDRVRKCLDLGIATHERMGDVSFADLGADPTDTTAAQGHLGDELHSFERSIWDKYDTDADYIKLRLSIYRKDDKSDKPLYTVRYKAGEAKPWQLRKGSRGALIGSYETTKQLSKDFNKMGSPKRESAEEGITSRDVQAAARSAWSASGATDFKLDIVRLGDHIIIYAKGPNGEDNVGISWHVHIPSILNSYETPHVEQFAVDSKGAWPKEPERTFDAKDLDELENQLVDEFEVLQEAIDIGKEG